jgi:phosphoribosylpyrophosphate synthetase
MNFAMNNRIVFLSGPMRGIPREEGLAWRKKATSLLASHFKVIHAYRGRELKETFSDPRAAVIRDLNDIHRSDIIIVNDSVPNASMIGTAMEIFWANQLKKIIIVFGNVHEKDYFMNYHIHTRVSDLKEACELAVRMFKD